MPTSRSKVEIDGPKWNPGEFAIERDERKERDGITSPSISLRHPTSPFIRWAARDDDISLQRMAHAYLAELVKRRVLELPPGWLEALADGKDLTFGWLPIGGPARKNYSPLVSFWVERTLEGVSLDRSLVLLASERLGTIPVGSGFGIRIVAHVRKDRDRGRFEARFTGVSVSLPFGPYASDGIRKQKWKDAAEAEAFLQSLVTRKVKKQIADRHGLDDVHFRGVRLAKVKGEPWRVERHGVGVGTGVLGARPSGGEPTYAFALLGTDTHVGSVISKRPLIAHAAVPGQGRIFPQDPPSHDGPAEWRKSRPTRSEARLDHCRVFETIGPGLNVPLTRPGWLDVIQCPGYVLEDLPGGILKDVDLPGTGPAIRSNDMTALSAYWNLLKLFERLDGYGMPPDVYFRIAGLPVKAFYRSGVRPGRGKDGQTVNAQVLPKDWKIDFFGPAPKGNRPTLHVHLALANLSHRARGVWSNAGREPAEPLGIATDERWIWHEIGHILLMARVGELEFRFAHSPGDALAAIVADPQSKLAPDMQWRGATFPWVFLPRRHDRSVLRGWSWCGSMHRALFLLPDPDRARKKAYWSEQILSSSLFRLYRCLGGDTLQAGTPNPDPVVRESASHYAVYLIMKAIELMPDPYAGGGAVNDAEDFVDLLMKADSGTGLWQVNVPVGQPPVMHTVTRVGGCAHKVVRWAFEAQGMYAPDPDNIITNAPGNPELVDVFIADKRPRVEQSPYGDVEYKEGGYVPVSLDWGPAALWHAKVGGGGVQEGIERQGNTFFVYVGNRGLNLATSVTVSVFGREWPTAMPPPDWNPSPGAWTSYTAQPAQNIPFGGVAKFGPFAPLGPVPPAGSRYLVLAQATCADDRANTDPASGQPCSLQSTPLADLVAGDNNLGLISITI